MDQDINDAADAFALAKIQAQDARDFRKTQADMLQALVDFMRSEFDSLPSARAEFVQQLALAIAPKYFTASTATLPESVQLDARNDAARFAAALTEAVRVVDEAQSA